MAQNNKNAARNAKAAARVRAAQQQKRQRMQWSIGIIVLVVVGIVVLVLAKTSKSDSSAKSKAGAPAVSAPGSIAKNLSGVPLDAIAAAYSKGVPPNPVTPITDTPRTKDGKPEVFYIGAEFCPYCAGERWALTAALSKFGEFSNLSMLESSEDDVPTLSYAGSKYTSKYVSFDPIEMQDQNHKPLEKPSDSQLAVFQKLGQGSFPFIDFGGKYMQSGGSVEVKYLLGKKQADIAKTLAKSTPKDTDPTSMQGNVNAVTGEFIDKICDLTGGNPGKVCKAFAKS